MNETELFETLIQSGILTEQDGEAVQLSSEFESAVMEYSDQMNTETDLRVVLEEVGTSPEHVANLVSIADDDPEFVARYLAVRDQAETLEFVESVRVLILLDQFSEPTPPTDGSPEPFFPIRGERLPAMLAIFPVTVVYVWREQCPDCDAMRDTLEAVFTDNYDQITLFSVYGPDCAKMLKDRYEVVGGPTTLFVVGGEIDARLQGAHVEEVVEEEVDKSLTTAEMQDLL